MFRITAVLLVLAAIAASAAVAAPPKQTFGSSSVTASSGSGPVTNHGLKFRLKLIGDVSDGNDAMFSLVITKTAGGVAKFVSAAIGWSFDGKAPSPNQFATLPDLPSSTRFVDVGRHWMRIGSLSTSTSKNSTFALDSTVTVPSRTELNQPNATFFCLRVAVWSETPGQPNASWSELSPIICAQYAVQ